MKAHEMAEVPERKALLESVFKDSDDLEKAFSQLENIDATFEDLVSAGMTNDIVHLISLGPVGWDCGRLVYLARMCYDADYISHDTAWEYIAEADKLRRVSFVNWRDFGRSYAIGRAMWGGQNAATKKLSRSLTSYLKNRIVLG
jgi:Protein of unknown function (DUF1266)